MATPDSLNRCTGKKRRLQNRIGTPKCSIISEAELEAMLQEKQEEGFQPSVPFVACLSVSMGVTELVRKIAGWPPALETGLQFDALLGPRNGIRKAHGRKPTCMCVQGERLVNALRKRKSGANC